MFLFQLYLKLPPRLRSRLKQILGGLGHGKSPLDGLKARNDALGKKRLDRSFAHVVQVLRDCGVNSLDGQRCLEFGSGYVPTDAIAMWLFGAERVISLDYNPIAHMRLFRMAIQAADIAAIEAQLGSVCSALSQRRFGLLADMIRGKSVVPEQFGWEYAAPINILDASKPVPVVDFIWSTNVMEHIAPSLLFPILNRLDEISRPKGRSVHYIDLRDHLDFGDGRYGFLDRRFAFDPDVEADARGNGMTSADWARFFERHADLGLEIIARVQGRQDLVPINPQTGLKVVGCVDDFITVTNVVRPGSWLPPAQHGDKGEGA